LFWWGGGSTGVSLYTGAGPSICASPWSCNDRNTPLHPVIGSDGVLRTLHPGWLQIAILPYRPTTNTSILWEAGHAKGRSHMRERVKEGG
jgi:hypothetical protein